MHVHGRIMTGSGRAATGCRLRNDRVRGTGIGSGRPLVLYQKEQWIQWLL